MIHVISYDTSKSVRKYRIKQINIKILFLYFFNRKIDFAWRLFIEKSYKNNKYLLVASRTN